MKKKIMLGVLIVLILIMGGQMMNHKKMNQDYLEAVLNEALIKFEIPAGSVSLMDSNDILYTSTQGYTSIDRQDQVSDEHYFHIGSCSKTVLSQVAGKLVEEGQIKWTDKLIDILPHLKTEAITAYDQVTLEDLLLCRAGISSFTDGQDLLDVRKEGVTDRESFGRHLLSLGPSVTFIESEGHYETLYSNASYTLASLMLEEASGLTYKEMVTRLLYDPLAIGVHFGWPNAISDEEPWGHGDFGQGLVVFHPSFDYHVDDLIEPAGNISMTPKDYNQLVHLRLQGLLGQDNHVTSTTYKKIFSNDKAWAMGAYNEKLLGFEYTGMDGTAGSFYCRELYVVKEGYAMTIMVNKGAEKAVDWITMKLAKAQNNWWWMFWV